MGRKLFRSLPKIAAFCPTKSRAIAARLINAMAYFFSASSAFTFAITLKASAT